MSADTRAVAVILHGFEVIDTVLVEIADDQCHQHRIERRIRLYRRYATGSTPACRFLHGSSASRLSLPGSRVAFMKNRS
ncbi:hypothetical protein M8494_14815 [Serratia ureilytica]